MHGSSQERSETQRSGETWELMFSSTKMGLLCFKEW